MVCGCGSDVMLDIGLLYTTLYYSILFILHYVPQMVGSAEGEMLEKNLIRNIS